jgi:hypothetical protein
MPEIVLYWELCCELSLFSGRLSIGLDEEEDDGDGVSLVFAAQCRRGWRTRIRRLLAVACVHM